jgi:Ser/Thr protein kinase RdoA (MazF antagonist)
MPIHKRHHWYEDDLRDMALRYFDESDKEVLNLFDSIVDKIKLLPTSVDDYGLIHTDLHFHNMYLSDGKLTFFDFDDCSYKHFISDIAIILYYRHTNRVMFDDDYTIEDYQNDVARMFKFFLLGYKKENTLDPKWYLQLNLFMSLRSVSLYIVMVAAGFKTHEEQRYRDYVEKAKVRALQHTMNLDLDRLLDGLY